jgi:hypothetical protein
MNRARLAHTLAPFAVVMLAACNNSSSGSGTPPPPPNGGVGSPDPTSPNAPPSTSAGVYASACTNGGDEIKDKIASPLLPRKAGDYCVSGEAKTYGSDGAKYTRDEVCTTAYDGECKIYENLGYKRYVSVRYVDGTGKPNTVDVSLWTFEKPDGAYAMFTKRVIADGDPLSATTKPLAAGAAASTGGGNANLWKGPYLVEMTFNTDDPNMNKTQFAAASQAAVVPIATAIGSQLPGNADLLPAAKALPTDKLIPLGIDYKVDDALGLKGTGPVATGYYQDGAKRWRMVSAQQSAMGPIKAAAGAQALAGVGDDGAAITVDKSEYVFAKKGNAVYGVGDESFGDDGAKLSKDDKVAKLKAWIASAGAAPAPSGSAAKKP